MAKNKLLHNRYEVHVVLQATPWMHPRTMYVSNIDHLPEGWILAPGEWSTKDDRFNNAYRGKARVSECQS